MVLSKRLNGALVKQKRVPFPKARNQEGMQVTLKVCCLKSGMPALRGRLWKYYVITAFLKEEHKEITML